MTDWTKAYQALAKAGYSDSDIERISGVTRSTVCNVRNGTWQYKHDPGYEGGVAVLAELEKVAERERLAEQESPGEPDEPTAP